MATDGVLNVTRNFFVLIQLSCHICKKGVREWGSGIVDSGVAGTGADEPTKLKEEDLNRPRNFHRK